MTRTCARTIAIDGPSASGKSAVGSRVASRLGYLFLDTGTMYRAITHVAIERGIDAAASDDLAVLAQTCDMQVRPGDGTEYARITCDGVDVTAHLRDPEVEQHVSAVSKVHGVRTAMVALQREIAANHAIVMVGRDIGTVVLPAADLKLYIDARAEVRADRRHREVASRGEPSSYEFILADLKRRDSIDSTREDSPLRPADDAVLVDTSEMTLEEVVEHAIRLAGC